MRALVIVHDPGSEAVLVGERLEARGYEQVEVAITTEPAEPGRVGRRTRRPDRLRRDRPDGFDVLAHRPGPHRFVDPRRADFLAPRRRPRACRCSECASARRRSRPPTAAGSCEADRPQVGWHPLEPLGDAPAAAARGCSGTSTGSSRRPTPRSSPSTTSACRRSRSRRNARGAVPPGGHTGPCRHDGSRWAAATSSTRTRHRRRRAAGTRRARCSTTYAARTDALVDWFLDVDRPALTCRRSPVDGSGRGVDDPAEGRVVVAHHLRVPLDGEHAGHPCTSIASGVPSSAMAVTRRPSPIVVGGLVVERVDLPLAAVQARAGSIRRSIATPCDGVDGGEVVAGVAGHVLVQRAAGVRR